MNHEYRPSGLILATKRSGTNFAHDILSLTYTGAVNEPLGLHNDTPVGKRNPLDPWNYSGPEHVSASYGHKDLKDDPYGSLLTRQFLGWVKDGGKLIKETDFLYLGWLLASVPIKTITIQRDPRASIASFKKSNLFEHWRYDEKMKQFAQTINETPLLTTLYGDFTGKSFFYLRPHQQLAFYYSVGISEIERNTKNYNCFQTTYENLVNDSIPTFQKITEFLNAPWNESIVNAIQSRTSTTRHNGIHGTFRKKTDLIPFIEILTNEERNDINAICAEFGIDLEKEKTVFQRNHVKKEKKYIDHVNRTQEIINTQSNTVCLVDGLDKPLFITKTLTTNRQYTKFLQWLVQNNVPLAINGKPLFYNDRPQGKINKNGDEISTEEIYAEHPVSFVNWICAALYSAWIGGRLPSYEEWQKVISQSNNHQVTNTNVGQRYSDTTDVTFFPPDERGLYDVLGNMSIWVHNTHDSDPYSKQRAGLGWNHSSERGDSPQPRPYWLGTAGCGIRPVFDSFNNSLSDQAYLSSIQDVITFLTEEIHEDEKKAGQELTRKISFLF